MKKKLPEEAAEYFETHSLGDVWHQLPESKPGKLSVALAKSIQARHAAAKSPISIRGPELGHHQLVRFRNLSRSSRS